MSSDMPAWTRWLLRADEAVTAALRAVSIARDELLLGWTHPAHRAAVTAWVYDRQRGYTTAHGLREWERAFVDTLPRGARILVGGAGAGREVVALRERGFDVVGFEPAVALVRAALTHRGIDLIAASYADVVTAAREHSGVLAPTFAASRFDAVVLGWGSLSHVTSDVERVELFEALRVLVPAAPVLVSFLTRDAGAPPGRAERFRSALRRGFARLDAPGRVAPGLAFLPWAGFIHAFTWDEIEALAVRTGYEIERRSDAAYPHAVFIPAR